MTKTDSKKVTLQLAGMDPTAAQGSTGVSEATWHATIADLFGTAALAAWPCPTYCLVRADRGTGAVVQGAVLAGIGSPWAVVCHHGTAYGTATGAGANRARRFLAQPEVNGDGTVKRPALCSRCAAGDAPVIGGAPAPAPKPATPRRARPAKAAGKPVTPTEQAIAEAADRKTDREREAAPVTA